MQKEKQLLPRLRFPEFEEVWHTSSLGENCKFNQGVQIPSSEQSSKYCDGFIRYLYIRDYLDDSFPTYVLNKYPNKIIEEHQIMMVNTGNTAGKAFRGKIGVLSNNSFKIEWDSTKLNDDYIYLYLTSDFTQNNIKRVFNSGGQPHLGHKNVAKLPLSFPKLKEQQKIANFLTSIDTQIQTLEKKKSLLEQYKKGVMQKIFKQELRFKDEDGNAFPEWSKKKLGDLTYKVGKKNKENIQYPIYSINNQEGFRPQSEQFEGLDSNDRGYDISLYKIVHKETFAYNPARINVGSIGYSYNLKEVIISSLYVCFKTNEELEDLYLLAYLDTDRFNKDILRYQEGGVRQYLFYDNLSQIKIPLPSNKEQNKIANFLSAIDENIALVNTKIEHTKAYKKGLLQQMFV
ncbi:Type I restriction enzyme, S subunit [Tenacibaculum soleae]|uniref:restriction endonuclease subunit S n=1 Tax=Tenacibaculum soleae TaxID=447689 RepID=UPI003AB47C56